MYRRTVICSCFFNEHPRLASGCNVPATSVYLPLAESTTTQVASDAENRDSSLIRRIASWSFSRPLYICFDVLFFEFPGFLFSRNVTNKNPCKETKPFVYPIQCIYLLAHTARCSVIVNGLTTYSIFKNIIILSTVNDLVKMVRVFVFIRILVRHTYRLLPLFSITFGLIIVQRRIIKIPTGF